MASWTIDGSHVRLCETCGRLRDWRRGSRRWRRCRTGPSAGVRRPPRCHSRRDRRAPAWAPLASPSPRCVRRRPRGSDAPRPGYRGTPRGAARRAACGPHLRSDLGGRPGRPLNGCAGRRAPSGRTSVRTPYSRGSRTFAPARRVAVGRTSVSTPYRRGSRTFAPSAAYRTADAQASPTSAADSRESTIWLARNPVRRGDRHTRGRFPGTVRSWAS